MPVVQGCDVDSYFGMHRGCSVRLYQVYFPLLIPLIPLLPLLPFPSFPPKKHYVAWTSCVPQDTHCPTDLPHLNMVQGPNGLAPTYHSCWKVGSQYLCSYLFLYLAFLYFCISKL